MSEVNDGKHFLEITLADQGVEYKIICEADPKEGECRSPLYDSCALQDQWDQDGADSLERPAIPITLKVPVKYVEKTTWDGQMEAWIEPVRFCINDTDGDGDCATCAHKDRPETCGYVRRP